MANIKEIELSMDKFLQNKNIEDLSSEDYDRLLDEVFYSRLKDIPSEKIEGEDEVSLSKNELLSTSPTYKGKSMFDLVDENKCVVVRVQGERLQNNDGLEFVLPFKSESDKRNFIVLLAYLDEISKIKYPESEINIL